MNARPLSVGVVGYGSIGSVVADALHAGRVPGAVLAGVTVSSHGVLRAARLQGQLHGVHLTSIKRPSTLVQPWMDDDARAELEREERRTVVFDGAAREAATLFPRSANVAAALALACGTWDGVEATIVADPDAVSTSHEIECCGEAGEYRFTIRSRPSSDNPASSAVVPYAVLRAIADDAGTTWRFQ